METESEINKDNPYEIFGVPTYLSLMKKYPEAREDILRLRESKNKGYIASSLGIIVITALITYFGTKMFG